MSERRKSIKLSNRLGLHTRAASAFVQRASAFDCDIEVLANGRSANGTRIIGLMMLAVPYGGQIEIVARGADAEEAVDALHELVANRFGEPQ